MKAQHDNSVSEVLGYVREAFGAAFKESSRTHAVWADVLEGVEERWLFEAAREICRQDREWPPRPGELRTLALRLRQQAESVLPPAQRTPPVPLTREQRLRFREGCERACPGITRTWEPLEPLTPAPVNGSNTESQTHNEGEQR